MNKVEILGADFDAVTLDQCVDSLLDAVDKGERGWVSTVNVAILMDTRHNHDLRYFIDKAHWVVADGQPLVWIAPLFNGHLPERVTGIDMVEALAHASERQGTRIYLLGAEQHVVDKVEEKLKQRYPLVHIRGKANGYFTEEEAEDRVRDIRDSGAQILLVAMGSPNQEQFIEYHWDQLGVNVAIGVGGSFDVIAGFRKRAPVFMQRIGMEWFYRLVQEPGRLWKRYFTTNVAFVLVVMKVLFKRLFSSLLRRSEKQ